MRLYELNDFTVTTEGVNDPNIFKAVFMAGAPGSGKTTVANRLFSGSGLKHLNVDRFWQLYKSKEQEGDYEKFWGKYQAQDDLYTQGRLGLLIDGTAKNPVKMNDVKHRLESIGYETAMVFVNTDLRTAIERAQKRASMPGPDMGRELDTKFIEDAWNRTQKALGNYQSMFGDRFYIIDNSDKSMTSSLEYAERQLRQWLSAPPKNPIAKKWIQQQRDSS